MQEIEKKKSDLGVQVPEGWNWLYFSDLFDFKNGINSDKESYGQGVRFVNVMEIINNSFLTYEMIPGSVTADENQQKLYSVIPGDVLFNRTSETFDEVGLTSVYEGKLENKVVFGGFVIRGRSITNLVEDKFKRYCFHSQLIRNQIIKSGQGVVRSNISQAELSKVKILLPPLPEQRAIADCLSTWDGAIQATQQLIRQKELQKKWLMQQLLTGKKRLKGFSEEWRETELKTLFDRVTQKNNEGNTNVVTISAQRGFVIQTEFFNKAIASDILDNYFLVERGDFCYNKSYSKGYPWGATKRLTKLDKAVVTTLYICFRLKYLSRSSAEYFEHFFQANSLDKGLMKIAHEGGRAHGLLNVTPSDFFGLKILTPEFEEQQAIASILSESDRELDLLRKRLAKLQEQKKGLMQVLLTGKRRVSLRNN
jgi:type I restriction enzyme S subunit